MTETAFQLVTWGRTQLTLGGEAVVLRPRERTVLVALAAHEHRSVSTERLIEVLWPMSAPASARPSLQNHVSRLRSAAPHVVLTEDTGYRLSGDVILAEPSLSELMSDEPFAELADSEWADEVRAAAHRRAADIWVQRIADQLSAGAVAADAEAFLGSHHHVSGAAEVHVRLLAASGRRTDALALISELRRGAAESGAEPDRSLRDLERQVFDDDPVLRHVREGAQTSETSTADVAHVGHLIEFDEHLAVLETRPDAFSVRLAAVTGPAGIGKTTLVERVRDRAHLTGVMTVLVSCSPEPSVPLEPIVDLLHQIVERFPAEVDKHSDVGALCALAPSLPLDRPEASAPPDRSAIFAAVASALGAVPRPLMVIVEDLHWATPLTLQMLDACVAASVSEAGVSIVVTSRRASSEFIESASEHLVLTPWTSEVVEEYVRRFGRSESWSSPAAEWVHRQSGGNPLHVRELTVAATVDVAVSGSPVFEAPADASPSLIDTLRVGLAKLSSAARRDVEAAAILGRRFQQGEWVAMGADAERSLMEAESVGVLVVEAGRRLEHGIQFRHDVLHRLVLDELAPGRRAELHDVAARMITSSVAGDAIDDRADEVAHHAVGALSVDPYRAIHELIRSIDVDTRRFAYESAIEKCRIGQQLALPGGAAPDPSSCVEFEVRLGKLMLRTADPGALDQLLSAAMHALDTQDDLLVGEAIREACRLGPTSVVGGVHPGAAELLDRAMSTVTDPQAVAVVATAGVMLYAISGEYDRCREYFERAASYRGDVSTRADALALAVLVLTERGDMDRRHQIESELAAIAASIGTADALWGARHLRMTNQVQTGDPEMRTTLAELEELAIATRQRARRWEYTNWSASVALTDGDPERAEQCATEALECLDAVAESLVMSAYGAQLFAIRYAQERVHELVDMVRPIVDGEGPVIGAWHAVLALAAIGAGDDRLAREQLELTCAGDFAVLDRDYTFNGALFTAALAACDLGDVDLAVAIEGHLAEWSGLWAFVGTCTMGPIDVALARVAALRGDTEVAVERARRAVSSAQRAQAPIYERQASTLLAALSAEG